MKKCLLITAFLFTCFLSKAQVNLEAEFFSLPDTVTNEYLDSVSIKVQKPNDYWMVGVYGGASLHFGYFNPSRLIEPMFQYPVYGFPWCVISLCSAFIPIWVLNWVPR